VRRAGSDGGDQWLLLGTQRTFAGYVDAHATEAWTEEQAPRTQPAPIYESRQFAAVTTLAERYGLAFYVGRNGVFTRVYPPLR